MFFFRIRTFDFIVVFMAVGYPVIKSYNNIVQKNKKIYAISSFGLVRTFYFVLIFAETYSRSCWIVNYQLCHIVAKFKSADKLLWAGINILFQRNMNKFSVTEFNAICIVLVYLRLISRICHSSLLFAKLLNFRRGFACLCTRTSLLYRRTKWNSDIYAVSMFCLRTCKSERDSLTVKFFDGATRGWQKEIDIFAALLATDTIS